MAVSLCVPPRDGELCAPVRFLVRGDSVVMELTARHRITSVEWDEDEDAVAMVVEITDPQTARPVDVRIDVLEKDTETAADSGHPDTPATMIGTITRDGRRYEVRGTYLGVVADEN
ncbi:hypothetical protein [Mycobacterium sp. 852002-10029_SCH5224772]|uniref:hypothetical protein n=1 Tax=Mycobacterium sp. 852002-10029_SCH5224772 TaxID=1834083 RepID=UPI0007FEBB39|nr:hypothetical protein [Mycobacterium sp. 852002-10029_SCH5224772]OBF04308.1 hypothetical protein A5775_01690 [Mycobacterium sp. 852002-10029_SCH5224772]